MLKLSFENTAIAFESMSDKDLRQANRLFKLVGKPWLVRVGKSLTLLAKRLGLLPNRLIKRTIFKQFCGGESIEECTTRIENLAKFNIGTILDYSVEGKTSSEDFEKTCNEIIETLNKGANNPHIPFAVFKITGIARFGLLEKANNIDAELTVSERQEMRDVHDRVNRICQIAHSSRTPVFIDAEESWIQDTIDRIADAMMARYNKEHAYVYNTIQLYRHDRLAFLNSSHKKAKRGGYILGLKLVRGAYMEKERQRALDQGYPSPIQPNKSACDKDYDLALNYCIENIDDIHICAGTHNEESSLKLSELLQARGIDIGDKRIYFAQLLGMSDHISYNLAHNGFNVAKYVPYGPIKEVIPYLLRRAQENTSTAGQTSRELSLILKEKQRRKKST